MTRARQQADQVDRCNSSTLPRQKTLESLRFALQARDLEFEIVPLLAHRFQFILEVLHPIHATLAASARRERVEPPFLDARSVHMGRRLIPRRGRRAGGTGAEREDGRTGVLRSQIRERSVRGRSGNVVDHVSVDGHVEIIGQCRGRGQWDGQVM